MQTSRVLSQGLGKAALGFVRIPPMSPGGACILRRPFRSAEAPITALSTHCSFRAALPPGGEGPNLWVVSSGAGVSIAPACRAAQRGGATARHTVCARAREGRLRLSGHRGAVRPAPGQPRPITGAVLTELVHTITRTRRSALSQHGIAAAFPIEQIRDGVAREAGCHVHGQIVVAARGRAPGEGTRW